MGKLQGGPKASGVSWWKLLPWANCCGLLDVSTYMIGRGGGGIYVGFRDWLFIREAVDQFLILLGPLLLLHFLYYHWASSVLSFESDLEMIGFLRCLFR